jgi:GTP-binding protein EngB required for normal cell division
MHSLPIFSPFIPFIKLIISYTKLKNRGNHLADFDCLYFNYFDSPYRIFQEGDYCSHDICLLLIAQGIRNDYILFGQMVKKAKVIFLGDTAVGKSCLISALNGHPISSTHQV